MGIKSILGILFVVIVIFFLLIYYFLPFNELEFITSSGNSNFSLTLEKSDMQFYPNMRYPDNEIKYKVYNCSSKKNQDARDAFDILENFTILNFEAVSSGEEITVTCNERERFEKGMFIAGEGGPTAVVKSGAYNVILHGKILLIKESKCERPNIALHELLHALGFVHSNNPNNIMYNFTNCKQTIGEDIPELVDKLYEEESLTDLIFENVSAKISGRYLYTNFSVRNAGLKNASASVVVINADDKEVREIELDELGIGDGIIASVENVRVPRNVKKLNFYIDCMDRELDKENNNISLELKE
jgi:hypothetical protein